MTKAGIDWKDIRRRLYGKERFFITKSGYVFDRNIFKVLSLFIIILSLTLLFILGGVKTYAYATCPSEAIGGVCENQFYITILTIITIALVLNHLLQKSNQFEEARKHERNKNKNND